MVSKFLTALSAIGLTACSVVGIRGEQEPTYRVTARVGTIEIRQYDARIAAETAVPGDEYSARSAGFRRIAHYIFGGNHARESIAMTAPVALSRTIPMTAPVTQSRDASGDWVVRFFMPASFTLLTLPEPDDDRVHLVSVPPEQYAVLRFTGSIAPEEVARRKQDLLAALSTSLWQPKGEPVAWFYDPPWTLPFLRRNEVAVPVTSG